MRIGLIGSGNIARALARGWGEPVLLTDSGSGRAAALAAEVGGQRLASNAELVEQADLVVLCHKPYQLDAVAEQAGRHAKRIVSTLARTSTADVAAAWPGVPVLRVLPNTAAELRMAASVVAETPDADPAFVDEIVALFERLGLVVRVEERLMAAANGVAGVGPAYLAVVAEAQVDAAVRHGLKPAQASALVAQAMAGTAALLQANDGDTLAVRRAVTSPGGVTARGLDALERHGLRGAFGAAMDGVLAE
jgi:pyrroline-5-carboxylate reductase